VAKGLECLEEVENARDNSCGRYCIMNIYQRPRCQRKERKVSEC
jgi:hypothetical protein